LRAKQGTHFLCANTHLHFDPAHEEVKILQSLLCARYIAQILKKLAPTPIQVLFAGDFNCEPGSRAIRMLQGQQISLRNFTANHQELDDSFICRVRQFIHRQLSPRAETVTEVKGEH
jgi:mRNA deadenylase 3'-5' endonuclease subunit Ccr4